MKVHCMAAALLIAASASVTAADEPGGRFSLGVGADYSTGKYGRSESTDVTYVPVMARYETDRWLFKLTVPYVSISGPGTVVGGDRPIVVDGAGNAQRRTVSGLGDVVTSAGYTAYSTSALTLDVTGKVKFATASESDGLGTGKNDYSLQADAYRSFGAFTAFAGAGYRWYGDPAGIDLRDVVFGSVGGTYKVTPMVTAGAAFDYRGAIVAGRDPIVELSPFVSVKITNDTKVQLYAVRGFTDASVDWGGGLVLIHTY